MWPAATSTGSVSSPGGQRGTRGKQLYQDLKQKEETGLCFMMGVFSDGLVFVSFIPEVNTFMVDMLSCFSFQPVLHDWCNKGCGMCSPICGMVHITFTT